MERCPKCRVRFKRDIFKECPGCGLVRFETVFSSRENQKERNRAANALWHSMNMTEKERFFTGIQWTEAEQIILMRRSKELLPRF